MCAPQAFYAHAFEQRCLLGLRQRLQAWAMRNTNQLPMKNTAETGQLTAQAEASLAPGISVHDEVHQVQTAPLP